MGYQEALSIRTDGPRVSTIVPFGSLVVMRFVGLFSFSLPAEIGAEMPVLVHEIFHEEEIHEDKKDAGDDHRQRPFTCGHLLDHGFP